MNRKLLILITTPNVIIGVLLLAACLTSAWHVDRLESNLATILTENVTSLEAAQELEIRVRQLRSHCFVYLVEPTPERLAPIQADNQLFEDALRLAQQSANTPEEVECVRAINAGYRQYRDELAQLRTDVQKHGPRTDFGRLADTHPIRHITDPCHELFRLNKDAMTATAQESSRVSDQAHLLVVLLGLGGPVAGVIVGYGVARGLSRSIYRLSVRVHDMAQRLDENDVTSVSLALDGDIEMVDRQMQVVVRRVEEVAERLRRHHHEMLRAEQLAAVGQLAASVAHEVRNPLTSIKLLVEAALRPVHPQPLVQEDLAVIFAEVSRLEQTVQGFLDFARPPTPRRSVIDLRQVVAQAVELVRARARKHGITISVPAPRGTSDGTLKTFADPAQLHTVLVNLLLNSLDAMPQGGEIQLEMETTSGGDVRITLSDTGPGIAPEMASRLFTPFASTKPTGTGLGLCISRRIVEDHGGRISADASIACGARFTIDLPQSEVAGRPDPAATTPAGFDPIPTA